MPDTNTAPLISDLGHPPLNTDDHPGESKPGRREPAPVPQVHGTSALADDFLRQIQTFADTIAEVSTPSPRSAPHAALNRLRELGALVAPLPTRLGGLGLGTEAGNHLRLLRLLASIGGGDLALGRLYEGHVNALILIASFGTEAQLARAARDAEKGMLFGVWNTGSRDLLQLVEGSSDFVLKGMKHFASGAAFVLRPVITAEFHGGWQMLLPRMESPGVQQALAVDRSSWHPLGMEASESYNVDFTGVGIEASDLLGGPGDFYRDPLFRGGAVRFAAVHAGGILRLYRMFTRWLGDHDRGDDPYQAARLGEVTLAAQEAILWIEQAAAAAETGLSLQGDKLASERMVECANRTRVAIERLATATMPRIIAGVGAHGLLQPHVFERFLRDLTMYLRQPAPDQTLAEIGRASLRRARLRAGGPDADLWQVDLGAGSMPSSYFEDLYGRSQDPWDFESSHYEAEKYAVTLASLPNPRYEHALEIGCSIGVLTEKLALRCDNLLSLDVSVQALESARKRCALVRNVEFARMQVPGELPSGSFDLILLSEVGYYLQRSDLAKLAAGLAALQPHGAHLVLVHHTPSVPDYPLTGDQVHDLWLKRPEWIRVHEERHAGYRLDVLQREVSIPLTKPLA